MSQPIDVQDVYAQFHARRAGSAERLGWNSAKDQQNNFTTMLDEVQRLGLKLSDLTVHDAGCGHGDLYEALQARGGVKGYVGTDFMLESLAVAQERFPGLPNVQLLHADLLTSPLPRADLTFCFGALAFHKPRKVEEMLHNLWRVSDKGLGFVSWWNLTPEYVHYEQAAMLRKCIRRFIREAKAKAVVERIGDFNDPVEALFFLAK